MTTKEPTTQLGELVTDRMEELGLTIGDLKKKLDVTYEHARRIVRGEGIPSKHVLHVLADTLGIPRDQAVRVATADKLRKKYGDIPLELAGKDPSLEPVERSWGKLNDEQKDMVLDMMHSMVSRNKGRQ